MAQAVRASLLVLGIGLVAACASRPQIRSEAGASESGMATWYDHHDSRMTASGEHFDENAMTAAHLTLPFGTWVRVTNQKNGRDVVVRINDRGPYSRGRIIDLSLAAARLLRMIDDGVVPVVVDVLSVPAGEH